MADIYLQVGRAANTWERLESVVAEIFDALVSGEPSNRAGFHIYAITKSAAARFEMLDAAIDWSLRERPELQNTCKDFAFRLAKYSARRNEIVHGMVLQTNAFFLCPTNIMLHKWRKEEGTPKFQYASWDIAYYAQKFNDLRTEALSLEEELRKAA